MLTCSEWVRWVGSRGGEAFLKPVFGLNELLIYGRVKCEQAHAECHGPDIADNLLLISADFCLPLYFPVSGGRSFMQIFAGRKLL